MAFYNSHRNFASRAILRYHFQIQIILRKKIITKVNKGWKPLIIFSISSILDVRLRSECATRRNFQCLAVELYKILSGLSLGIMKDVFPLNSSLNYGTRNGDGFYTNPIKLLCRGTESLSFLALKRWELVPNNKNLLETLSLFRAAIKFWNQKYAHKIVWSIHSTGQFSVVEIFNWFLFSRSITSQKRRFLDFESLFDFSLWMWKNLQKNSNLFIFTKDLLEKEFFCFSVVYTFYFILCPFLIRIVNFDYPRGYFYCIYL